ncbi:S-adenosylmethionine-binding protein [bacterium]|nr:S-adenosylmethionine-binding protein [bacterium]
MTTAVCYFSDFELFTSRKHPRIAETLSPDELTTAGALRLARKLQQVEVEPPPLPEGKYKAILADPPWQYSNAGLGGAAEKHYATLSLEEICELEDAHGRKITDLPADNSVLFLWVTSSFLQEGLEVCRAWGFPYKTHFIWIKDKETYGKLGFYTYSQHEFLFVAVRGSCLPDGELVPSIISAPKSKHSRKPDITYEIIEQMYKLNPNRPTHIELFARNGRDGWTSWGVGIS